MLQTLIDGSRRLGIHMSPEQLDLCCRFSDSLLQKNTVMNLTAITEPSQVAALHFLDSFSVLQTVEFPKHSVVDVGCGAGFPGVPLLIAQQDIHLTLLDSQKKRITWLTETLSELQLSADCVCARAEDYASDHREQFDIAVSRAVAQMNILSELALPLVRQGGYFIAMKSTDSDAELSNSRNAISLLGGQVESVKDYLIPCTDVTHRLIVIKKIRSTPTSYPRRFAKIKQNPL